ncbi:peptidase, partial [bacterium]|nr:peptidase [bacterium]
AEWFGVWERKAAGVPVLVHDAFTNGVVYAVLHFDMRVLPQELIPYAALLSEMLGSLDTDGFAFGELETELNVHTGGFSAMTEGFLENRDDSRLLPKFTVSVKALRPKTGRMFELAEEILLRTKFDDPDRIRTVLTRHQSRLDGAAIRNGFGFAYTRAQSYIGEGGAFNEKTRGFDYYWFVSDLADSFDVKAPEIAANLKRTAGLLFRSGTLTAAVTGGPEEAAAFAEAFERFAKHLPQGRPDPRAWAFDIRKRNEGFATPSKVQYAVQGYNLKKLGHPWSGRMHVLGQVLSTDWLQTRIRVIGGAYGGFARIHPNGTMLFCSYRDPNLEQTLDSFAATPGFLRTFEPDSTAMTRYIIGTIANLDQPRTASEKGREAVRCRLERVTAADLQAERDDVLATTAADIRAMAPIVSDVLGRRAFCVYGNEEKIRAAAGLFGTVLNPIR